MAFDLTIMRDQVRGMRDMLPVTANVDGSDVIGWRESLRDEKKLAFAGVGADVQHSIGFLVADLPSVPDIGGSIIFDDTTYQVLGRNYDPAKLTVRFDLGEEFA